MKVFITLLYIVFFSVFIALCYVNDMFSGKNVLLFLLSLGFCSILIYAFNKIKFLKLKLIKLSKSNSIYKSLIKSSDYFWITFDKNSEIIGFSDTLKTLFETQELITKEFLISFLNKCKLHTEINDMKFALKKNSYNSNNPLEEKTQLVGNYFEELLENLIKFGRSFELIVKHNEKYLKLSGIQTTYANYVLNTIIIEDKSFEYEVLESLQNENHILKNEKQSAELILDEIDIPIWIRNEKCALTFCNNAYANILNISKHDVIKKNLPLINGSIYGEGDSLAKSVQKTRNRQSIDQNIIVDGHKCKFKFTESLLQNNSTVGYAIDKTQEELILNDLNKHIKAQANILETMSTSIAIFDSEMKLSFFNSSYQRMTSIEDVFLYSKPKLSEVLDKMRMRRKLPEIIDFNKYKQEKMALFTSNFKSNFDYMHIPDGRTLRSIEYPYPLGGVMFIYEDVTDRLTLERKHNTLIEVQKETLDNLYEGVAVYGSNNKLKFANPAFAKIWNLDDQDVVIGTHISKIIEKMKPYMNYGDDWNFYKDNIISNLTDRIPKNGRLFRTDNFVINFSYVPLSDGSHVHSYIDVTDSWKVEKALYEKNSALEEADKIKSKFITTISDELKQPINQIIQLSNDCENNDISKKIINHSKELLDLIDDLTDFASIETGIINLDCKEISINNLIEDVTHLMSRRSNSKQINVTISPENEKIFVKGDYKRLKQILINLLNNAIYSGISDQININVAKKNSNVEFSIDNITFSEKSIVSKTIGPHLLPIIKNIIELHGGKIKSQKNENSFFFFIPTCDHTETNL